MERTASYLCEMEDRSVTPSAPPSAPMPSYFCEMEDRSVTPSVPMPPLKIEDELPSLRKNSTALGVSFNQRLRPLLDVVDRLRNLGVMNEGIHLPTIVVIGDQSSGKTSVLESLAGVSLPKGQGIVTRVPLILRLKKSEKPNINIEYASKSKQLTEDMILSAIESATDELAGVEKGICDKPITLAVSKPGAPDLTLIDLPGITRVPVHGQPADIYDQIARIIRHYIAPDETIILNVLSAAVDFATCECIKFSKEADSIGERTIAVVTKVDKSPEDLYDKVMSNAIKVGLGYVCVRNRTDEDDSHEAARQKEQALFLNHPVLCKLDRSMVGVAALADKLMHIQAESIGRLLPKIVEEIEITYTSKRNMLEAIPVGASSPVEALMLFFRVLNSVRNTMEAVLMRGDVDALPDDTQLHFTARMHELALKYAESLQTACSRLLGDNFVQEIETLVKETRGVTLPNIVPDIVIKKLLRWQVDAVSSICTNLIADGHTLAQRVAFAVLEEHACYYPNLYRVAKQAAQKSLGDSGKKCTKFVNRMLEKAATIIFANSTYTTILDAFNSELASYNRRSWPSVRNVAGVGEVDLSKLPTMDAGVWGTFCNSVAYWKVLERRLADEIPMELRYSIAEFLSEKLEKELGEKVLNGDVSEVMSQGDEVVSRRKVLQESVSLLQECRAVILKYLGSGSPHLYLGQAQAQATGPAKIIESVQPPDTCKHF